MKKIDSHYNINNYAFQGVPLRKYLEHMLSAGVVRSVLMPLPIQQRWEQLEKWGDGALPNTWLGSEADMFYYSAADPILAALFRELEPIERLRFDPHLSGMNPMDGNASKHVRRMLTTFPGVFNGIGELTVHKECVSDKMGARPLAEVMHGTLPPDVYDSANGKATLYSPALVALLQLAHEIGLPVTLHCDAYHSKVKANGDAMVNPEWAHYAHLQWLGAQSNAQVIWAHAGLGKYVRPTQHHVEMVAQVLDNNAHWRVNLSWGYIQKYIINPDDTMPSTSEWVAFCEAYQDRILWGTDLTGHTRNVIEGGEVKFGRPLSAESYQAECAILDPLWDRLGDAVATKICHDNHAVIFDEARRRVREWEAFNANRDQAWK